LFLFFLIFSFLGHALAFERTLIYCIAFFSHHIVPSILRFSPIPIAAVACQVSMALSVLVAAFPGICVSKMGGLLYGQHRHF